MPKVFLSPENRPKPHGAYAGYPDTYEHDVCYEIAHTAEGLKDALAQLRGEKQ